MTVLSGPVVPTVVFSGIDFQRSVVHGEGFEPPTNSV